MMLWVVFTAAIAGLFGGVFVGGTVFLIGVLPMVVARAVRIEKEYRHGLRDLRHVHDGRELSEPQILRG